MKKIVKVLSVVLSALLMVQFAAVGAGARAASSYLDTFGGSPELRYWLHDAMGSGLTRDDVDALLDDVLELNIFEQGNIEELRGITGGPLSDPNKLNEILYFVIAVAADGEIANLSTEVYSTELLTGFDIIYKELCGLVIEKSPLEVGSVDFHVPGLTADPYSEQIAMAVLVGELVIWALDDAEWAFLVTMLDVLISNRFAPVIVYLSGILEDLSGLAQGLTVGPINFGDQDLDAMSQDKKIAIAFLVGELIILGLDDHLTIGDYGEFRVWLHDGMGSGLGESDLDTLAGLLGPGLIDLVPNGLEKDWTQTDYDNLRGLIDDPFGDNNALSAIFMLAFAAAKGAWPAA